MTDFSATFVQLTGSIIEWLTADGQFINAANMTAEDFETLGAANEPYEPLGDDTVPTDVSATIEEDEAHYAAWVKSLKADGFYIATQNQCCGTERPPFTDADGINSDFNFSGPFATLKEAERTDQ